MPTSNPLGRTRRTRKERFHLAPLGDSAITVEFGDEIDPHINARVVAFAKTLADHGWSGILDIVPTYRSVTLYFDALQWTFDNLADRLRRLPRPSPDRKNSRGTLHEIPVLYGGEWGPDLDDVATFSGLLPDQVVALHASIHYRVYMLGFSPGFPYLGLVPEQLAIPRLATPRTNVPAGSVGIADHQTGIYPSSTPGGWRLIGQTPISLYRESSSTPFLLKAGDFVQFKSIDQNKFEQLRHETQHADH